MEIFQSERALYCRLFWLPIGFLLLGAVPLWQDWQYPLALACTLLAIFLSGAVLLWGVSLVVLGLRLGAAVRSLVLAALIGAIPFGYGMAVFIFLEFN